MIAKVRKSGDLTELDISSEIGGLTELEIPSEIEGAYRISSGMLDEEDRDDLVCELIEAIYMMSPKTNKENWLERMLFRCGVGASVYVS